MTLQLLRPKDAPERCHCYAVVIDDGDGGLEYVDSLGTTHTDVGVLNEDTTGHAEWIEVEQIGGRDALLAAAEMLRTAGGSFPVVTWLLECAATMSSMLDWPLAPSLKSTGLVLRPGQTVREWANADRTVDDGIEFAVYGPIGRPLRLVLEDGELRLRQDVDGNALEPYSEGNPVPVWGDDGQRIGEIWVDGEEWKCKYTKLKVSGWDENPPSFGDRQLAIEWVREQDRDNARGHDVQRCGRCKQPLPSEPVSMKPAGVGYCDTCVAQCHESTEYDHECAVCRPVVNRG